ncbi:hypothetical protein A5701_21710 [Mycobacterium sp. E3305]|nr:TetR/AcrR family transcriptional regulator C-terminal domain-containing protein [Mycobacterium sp. E3305]OBG74935.1 hypothetical protein A5701_21710 [Mycobacterium sp. E3305]
MRARFTLAEVRAHAMEIVDRDGLNALKMRSLASALGTGPMTLYNYVRDREELEALVAEAVLADVKLPPTSEEWLADVKSIAIAVWESMRRHRNAVPLVLTRRTVSNEGFAPAEQLVAALVRGGLADQDLLAAFRGVLSLIMGAAQVELAGPVAGGAPEQDNIDAAGRIGRLAADRHPHLAALASTSQRSSMSEDFDRALDMLLAGIQTRADASRTERNSRRTSKR